MNERRHQITINKSKVTDILELIQAVNIEPRNVVVFPGRGNWIIEVSTTQTKWNVLARKMIENKHHKEMVSCS